MTLIGIVFARNARDFVTSRNKKMAAAVSSKHTGASSQQTQSDYHLDEFPTQQPYQPSQQSAHQQPSQAATPVYWAQTV
jgi:hypothetical protein